MDHSQARHIGPYSVVREIGRGGMGVVFLATDTRLDRDVAIKALPEDLATDSARLERFEREAKALAQLNHPNVAGIYGLEEQNGERYLILEYVEGDTLEERLDQGALPVDEALEFAIQIAAGIEAAHDAGIVHRDLKPGNVKITPEGAVKVLDFGLARSDGATASSITAPDAPTLESPVLHSPTIPGAIMGTAPYMSPEQARGRRVDKRTDIWSFGVVLFEMLTGISPFKGETASDSIGAILHKDIDLDCLPPTTPPMARHALARCLERNKANRYRDIGDVRIELERARAEPEPVEARGGWRVSMALLAVSAIVFALAGAGLTWFLKPEAVLEPMHVAVSIPERFESVSTFALSPDGRTLAMIAVEKATGDQPVDSAIYVRKWSEQEFRKLAGTDLARFGLVFSPNGDRLGFATWDGHRPTVEVRSMPVDGGPVTRAYEITQRGLLGSKAGYLTDDELIVLSQDEQEIYRVKILGGKPELAARLLWPGAGSINRIYAPRTGGRFVVVERTSQGSATPALHRVDLETAEISFVLEDASSASFLSSGHIAFRRNDSLWIAPFDLDRAEVTGTARVCLSGFGQIVLDRNGDRAVYRALDESAGRSTIVIVNVSGEVVETLMDVPGDYNDISLSPSGQRLVYEYEEGDRDPPRVWVLDITSGLTRPVTPRGEDARAPRWTPDGRITYRSTRGPDQRVLMVMDAVQGAAAEPLLPRSGEGSVNHSFATFSPDGRHVIIADGDPDRGEPGLYLYDVGDGDSGRAFFASSMIEGGSTFRPDGKWVAYHTNGTGRFEIYLRPFVTENPDSAPIHPVTKGGGISPMWSADGGTLYYWGVDGESEEFFAVTVQMEPELTISQPRMVFKDMKNVDDAVVMSDGRFIRLQAKAGTAGRRPDIRLILNWGLGEETGTRR